MKVELVEAPPQVFLVIHDIPLPPVYTRATGNPLLDRYEFMQARLAMEMAA